MVTAELALLLPALVAVTALLLALIGVAGAQLAVAESARAVAREVARGGELDDQRRWLRDRWPKAAIAVSRTDGLTTVTVTRPVRLPGGIVGLLDLPTLRGTAVVADESTPRGEP